MFTQDVVINVKKATASISLLLWFVCKQKHSCVYIGDVIYILYYKLVYITI